MSLARAGSIYAAAALASRAVDLGVAVGLSFWLAPSEYGAWGIYFVLRGLGGVLLGGGLSHAIGRSSVGDDAATRLDVEAGPLFQALRALVVGLVGLGAVGVGALGALGIEAPAYALPGLLAGGATALVLGGDQMLVARKRTVASSTLTSAAAALPGLVAAGLAVTTFDLGLVLWGHAGTLSLVALVAAVTLRRPAGLPPRKGLVEAIRFGLPLLLHQVGLWTLNLSDRLVVQWLRGPEAVAALHLASQLARPAHVVGMAVVKSWWPGWVEDITAMERHAGEDGVRPEDAERVRTSATKILWVYGALAAGALLTAPLAAWLLRGSAVPVHLGVLLGLIVGAFLALQYTLPTTVLFQRHDSRPISRATGAAAILNVALNLALVPRYGVPGAVVATVVAYAAQTLGLAWAAQRARPFPWPLRTLVAVNLGAFAGAALMYFGAGPLLG